MLPIRLVALDLDGTVFDDQKRISPRTLAAIQAALEQGVLVLPATGRNLRGVPKEFLEMPGVRYALTSNGATVSEIATGRRLVNLPFDPAQAEIIYDAVKPFDCMMSIFIEGDAYTSRENAAHTEEYTPPELLPYFRSSRHVVEDIHAVMRAHANGIEKFSILYRDATVYGTNYVTIVEIMGRNAGWLTAAAALARAEDCEGVDMICLPEIPFNVDHFVEKVARMQAKKPSIVIAVSEGVKLEDGRYVCELADDVHAVDAFGHKALTGTARFLANTVARRLDTKTRCIELSTLQRCAGHLTSRTDITEAYQVGGAAAKAAFEGHTGEMVALKRISNAPYQCTTELHPICEVANLEKKVPLEWINEDHTDMKPEFLAYALPLIQAELTPIYVEGLPHHIYLPE